MSRLDPYDVTDDESKIIKRVLAGRRNDFARLVALYQDKIRRLCFSFLRSEIDADEAAQDIFVKAYKALSKFRGESRFSTWLYRIGIRHCQDLLRSRAKSKSQSLETLLETHSLELNRWDMEKEFENQDLIQSLLATLHPRHVEILMMREANGYSYEEISAILKISVDSVKGRLKRARREIQKKFRHFFKDPAVQPQEAKHE